MNKSPAFQFYPADFLSDENVVLMSLAARGAYITLICYCWREGSIPADMARLGRLCGIDSSAMAELWTELYSCFELANGRYMHPRLERERLKQYEHSNERKESGRKGALSRWSKAKEQETQADREGDTNDSSAIAQPSAQLLANDASSSSSSSSSSSINTTSTNVDVVGKSRSQGSRSRTSRPSQCDPEYLEALSQNPAYQGIDVKRAYAKMCVWCENKRVQPTRSRFINWLNREDKPMSVPPAHPKNGSMLIDPNMLSPKTRGNAYAVQSAIESMRGVPDEEE